MERATWLQRSLRGFCAPHCPTTRWLLRKELCNSTLPTNISLGDKSSPFSQAPRLGVASSVHTERILTRITHGYKKREMVSSTSVTSLCGEELRSVSPNSQSNNKDLHSRAPMDDSQGLENFNVKLKKLKFN